MGKNLETVGIKTFLLMVFVAGSSALAATLIAVGVLMARQDAGTPLIGSERWFIFYMLPVIFGTLLITVFVYRKLAQEKITFNY